jgi:DNA-binding transcriptional regulator LsrR (DeoR family)
MDDRREREDVRLLLHVARLYYEDQRTQADIARSVGYSRPTVSRLLARAQARGIVRITIAHPLERILAIEERLRSDLGLKTVRVTETRTADSIDEIGRAASDLLPDVLEDGKVLAVGNGRSIAALARHLPEINRPHSTVVQLLGSLPGGLPAWGRDSPTLCWMIASCLGTTSARMPIPLFVDDPALAQPLKREERVATTLALAARADVAVVGVAGTGARGEGDVLAEYMTPEIEEAITRGNAVGHILDQHFNAAGNHVPTPLSPRTLALSLEGLRDIPLVIGIACGSEKVDAIIAAARGGILNGLVTDEYTAALVLERLTQSS